MANRILRSPRARLDLLEIWGFIAEDNETAADAFLDRIENVLRMLRDNPLAGRARPELGRDIRSFAVGNYVLFYRPIADGIDLARALNGRQDIHGDDIG